MMVLLSEFTKVINESKISKMVRSCIDFFIPLLRRPYRSIALQGTQSRNLRQNFASQKLEVWTFFNSVVSTWNYHHWNQENHPVRIRLVWAFYQNFEISNSRIKPDIENLFSLKRFKYCKNVIGFFRVVLSAVVLEISSESVFWSKSHVWREMREIGKSSVGVYQVTEYFDTIFEKI